MAVHKFVVFSNATAGREAEFNQWYDEVHLGEVCQVPGVVGASRYSIRQTGDAPPRHRYLAIYEMETTKPDTVVAKITRRAQSGEIRMTDAIAGDVEAFLVDPLTSVHAASRPKQQS